MDVEMRAAPIRRNSIGSIRPGQRLSAAVVPYQRSERDLSPLDSSTRQASTQVPGSHLSLQSALRPVQGGIDVLGVACVRQAATCLVTEKYRELN